MLFLLFAGSHDRAIRMGSAIAYICDRIYVRLDGVFNRIYVRSHVCAIENPGGAGVQKSDTLFGQIARSCDHRHGLYEVSSSSSG
jgi:hypothetical protein